MTSILSHIHDPHRTVVESICREHGVSPDELLGRRRFSRVATARKHVWLYLHDVAGWSYPELGALFDRDHTTVMDGAASVRVGPKRVYPEVRPPMPASRVQRVAGEGAWLIEAEAS